MFGLNFLKKIREKIYLKIWPQKLRILSFFKYSSILVSLFTIFSIIFYYGFEDTRESHRIFFSILHFSFSFYFVKYIISLLFSFHFWNYIKKTWFECLVLMFWISNAFLFVFWNLDATQILAHYLKIPQIIDYSIIAVQLYFFVVVGVEVSKIGAFISKLNIGPSGLLLSAFFIMISLGTALLMMPEMTTQGISFVDALFTATSASCVTGLVVLDTPTAFTFKGHLVILMLMQLGGINIVSFATFFAFMAKSGSGLRYTSLIKDVVNSDKLSNTRSILKDIILFSFSIEIVGALMMVTWWQFEQPGWSLEKDFFYAIFHSVSAFNNAGFSLWHEGLHDFDVRHSYFIQTVIMLLVFLGGIGFLVIQDVVLPSSIARRKAKGWRGLQLNSRISIGVTLVLILFGFIFFFFAEQDNSLKDETLVQGLMASFFQSVASRTAGFSTLDFSLVGQPALLMVMFLMFVGAAPGSTGGGIKTTTFYLLIKQAIATITGKKNIESGRNSIPFSLIDKAATIFLFSIGVIFISLVLLSFTEPDADFLHLMFEEVSAFGTVGLSTGLTPELSDPGKIIITINMYIGRLGPLTLAFALSKKVMTNKYRYPNANIMVG